MNKKGKRRIFCVLIAFIVVAVTLGVSFTTTYNKNTISMDNLANGNTELQEGSDELIAELSKAKDLVLIDKEAKLFAMTMLTLNHYLRQDYAMLIETAIQTIYLAEKYEQPYYAAWNCINMSEVFMLMSEYEMAEELIEKALAYEIEDQDKQDWVNETAYIYLADLKAKNGKKEEAFKYITDSMKYADEEDYDYTEMLLKRNAIKAQLAFEEGDYLYAQSLLDRYPMDVPEDALLMESVYLPVQEIYAKIFVARGEIEEGMVRSDAILAHESEIGYEAKRLAFLTDLTKLFEGVDENLYAKYSELTMEAYEEVMRQNAQVMSEYIFNIYSAEYIDNEEDELRNIYLMVAFFVAMLIFVLFVLLANSRQKSITDPLTGLYNRRCFESTYKKLVKKETKLAVMMFDVDHFKRVNDNYGHEVGDEVLVGISQILNEEKPSRSKAFRMGGEEFCIIYKSDSLEDAVEVAESIRIKTEALEWTHGSTITISGGVAFAEPNLDLYKLADEQLYISKNNGRNQINYVKI